MSEHAGKIDENRDLNSWHGSYSDICEAYWSDLSISSSTYYIYVDPSYDEDESTDGWYDCACGCGAWSLERNEDMICWYQSMTEAMNSCMGPSQVDDCEDYCSRDNADYLFGIHDCVWSYLHWYYWFYGYCNYYSSQDSSSDPNLCLVRDNPYIGDPDFCDDFSHNNKHDGSDDEEGNSSSSNTDEDATNDRDDEDSEEEEAADLSSAFQTASPLLIATVAASVLSFFFCSH